MSEAIGLHNQRVIRRELENIGVAPGRDHSIAACESHFWNTPADLKTLDDPGHYGLPYENVSFPTSDGLTLRGWFIPAAVEGPTGKKATILVGHGYPFDKANILHHALFLHSGFHLLFFDFRYFRNSDGSYTTAGLLETRDVEAAVGYLKQREDVDPSRIGALGFSMRGKGGQSAIVFADAQTT